MNAEVSRLRCPSVAFPSSFIRTESPRGIMKKTAPLAVVIPKCWRGFRQGRNWRRLRRWVRPRRLWVRFGYWVGQNVRSGPPAVGIASGDMTSSHRPRNPFSSSSPQLLWGITQCRDRKCWLPLPHGSGTIVNLTPAAWTPLMT